MDLSTPDDLARKAAYHGPGWSPRTGSLAADVRAAAGWRACGARAEWDPLRTAQIALPDPDWPVPSSWDAVQYAAPADFAALRAELAAYAATLAGLGVEVLVHDLAEVRDRPLYNGVFVRDQYLMTPEGAVVARMGSTVRAGEERFAAAELARAGVPLLATVRGTACFEGADALWITGDTLLVGVGNRTDEAGARQVARLATDLGCTTRTVRLPRTVQHLLGLLRPVAPGFAVLRAELAPAGLPGLLAQCGVRTLDLPESAEIVAGQALNFVVVREREVVMADGCPEVRARLEAAGLEVVATVPCRQLRNAAGGPACATGIVHRAVPGPPAPPAPAPAPAGGTGSPGRTDPLR
jgi:N-dimethylarginine dimethylaminohydrolase